MPSFGGFVGISRKITLLVTSLFVLSSTLLVTYCYTSYYNASVDTYGLAAQGVAAAVAATIGGKDLNTARARQYVDSVALASWVKDVYTVTAETTNKEAFTAELELTLDTGMNTRTRIYGSEGDARGRVISGFAPVFDSAGRVVGAVGVDVPAERAIASVARFRGRILLGASAMILLASLFVHWYAKRSLGEPIGKLAQAATNLADGNIDMPGLPAMPPGDDEIGVLRTAIGRAADAVNTLTLGVDSLTAIREHDLPEKFDELPGKFLIVARGVRKILTIIDHIDSLVYITDMDYNLIFFNRTMAARHGIDPVAAPHKLKCWRAFGLHGGPCPHCRLRELMSEADRYPSLDWELEDGQLGAWFHVKNSMIRWIDGTLAHFCIMSDITERKIRDEHRQEHERALLDAANAAAEASRLKTAFLANMSHEIRTPMNGIIGFSELAAGDADVPQRTLDYLEKIRESAEGLLQIIDNILDISKIEAGRMELEKIPFRLHDVISICADIGSPRAEEKGIALRFDTEPEVPLLLGDPTKLRQILLNLISNAIKFTDRGGVRVSSSLAPQEFVDDGSVRIRFDVQDSGVGMDEVQIGRIFDPFNQGDASTTRRYGGTGLGLAIAGSMVELMGGELSVESARGVGSKFSFVVAFETAQDAMEAPLSGRFTRMSEKPPEALPLFKGEVLVCEDNATNQEVIRRHLERLGLGVTVAEDGAAGVEAVARRMEQGTPFDLILMDIQMPVMDGLEAAKRLAELGSRTPIVALTANVMQDARESYAEHGMPDCLAKPLRTRELCDCLLAYLEPAAAADPDEIWDLLERLAPLLDSSNSHSLDLLDEIRRVLHPMGDLCPLLVEQMEDYEFERAGETLREIRRRMEECE